jgi:hypothetical protein
VSALAPRTPTGGSRHWVAWKTKVLTDADVMLMPNIARMAFPYLLALSGSQGLEGRIPSSPRSLQVVVRCDGGVAEMAAALGHLIEAGLLVDDPAGDTGFLFFHGWEANQSDRGGSATRPRTSAASQNVRRHNEGKHEDVAREGCELCAPAVVAPAAVARESEASAVKRKLWDRCTDVVALAEVSGNELVAVYEGLYEWTLEQAPRFAEVTGIGEASLLNIVVNHAATTFLDADGTGPDKGTLNGLHGLRRDHGADILAKIALSAKADHPLAYIQGIYRDAK